MLRFFSFSSRSFLSFSICSGVFFGFRAKYLVLIFRLKIPAWVQSPFSIHNATCSRMNSVFSLRSMDPKVSTCNSHRMSAAALRSPCSLFMSDRIRVTRARSTSTKIYNSSLDLYSCTMSWSIRSYLALSDCPQRLDQCQLLLRVRGFFYKRHGDLYHLSGSLFELAMLLREQ